MNLCVYKFTRALKLQRHFPQSCQIFFKGTRILKKKVNNKHCVYPSKEEELYRVYEICAGEERKFTKTAPTESLEEDLSHNCSGQLNDT